MLITLEGLDGGGKTTVWEALHDVYPDATFTREPTDSWYGEAVDRSIAADDADPLAELFLLTADHADHLSGTIEPALADGDLVISDRYSDSRFAYLSAATRRQRCRHRPPTRVYKGNPRRLLAAAGCDDLPRSGRPRGSRARRPDEQIRAGRLPRCGPEKLRATDRRRAGPVRPHRRLAVAGGGHRAGRGGSVGVAGRVVRRRAQR